MAKSSIPRDDREWPEYEFREFPKHLGFDAFGADLIADNADHEAELAGEVVYPKVLGKDKNDKDVVAVSPTDEDLKAKLVVDGTAKRGPGRPPKLADPVKAD